MGRRTGCLARQLWNSWTLALTRGHGRWARRDEVPRPRVARCRQGIGQVGDGGQTLGVDRGQPEGGTPDVELEGHGLLLLLLVGFVVHYLEHRQVDEGSFLLRLTA